jgi:hypothetical protein
MLRRWYQGQVCILNLLQLTFVDLTLRVLRIKICQPFWCPEKINVYKQDRKEKKELHFPLPNAGTDHYNFTNSVGLSFEISHVNNQIRLGRTESDVISLDESLEIMRIMDKAREIVGCVYPSEK